MNRIERETERDYRSIPLSLPLPPPSPPPSACTRLCASWRYAGPRADRNPTDVQHVYVSQATLTLQFMRALTGPQPFHLFGPRPPSSPPAGPLNTTANLPTRFDVQVHSPQEGRSLSLSLSRRHGFASSSIYPRVLAPLKSTAFVDPPVFIRIFVVDRYLSFPALVELRSSPLIKFEETFESLVPALVVARNGTNATVWTGVLYFSNVLLPPKIVREWGRCRGQV